MTSGSVPRGVLAADCILYENHLRVIERVALDAIAARTQEDLLLLLTPSKLVTYSTATPAAPDSLGSVALPSAGEDLAVTAGVAYVAGGSGGLLVVDVSDPAHPSVAATLSAYTQAKGVDVDGDKLALADGTAGVHVFEISSPLAPSFLGTFDTFGIATRVDLQWPFAHVADFFAYQIADFTNPAAPTGRGLSAAASQTVDVAVEGTRAAVAHGDYGLSLADVSNPDQIVTTDRIGTLSGARAVEWNAGSLLVGARFGLATVGASGGLLDWRGQADTRGDGAGVAAKDDVAYLASQLEVGVIGIAAPDSPRPYGSRSLAATVEDVEILSGGTHALFACGTAGVVAVVVSDRANPVVADTLAPRVRARGVAVLGGIAAVADGGLRTVDVSDPGALVELGFVMTPGGGRGELVVAATPGATHAYLADGAAGLVVVDITNPAAPAIAGVADTPGFALDVAKVGDRVFVADDFAGVRIFDVSDPASPTYLDAFDTPGSALGIDARDDLVYVADGYPHGLRIFRDDGGAWNQTAFAPLPDLTADVRVIDDFAYVVDQRSLHVFDVSIPSTAVALGATIPTTQPFDVAASADALWTADLTGAVFSWPKPCAPTTALDATALEATPAFWAVDLAWRAPSGGRHEGFRVERSDGGPDAYRTISPGLVRGTGACSWTDADVDAGATYFYRLVVVEAGGGERRTAPVAVTTPRWPSSTVTLEAAAPNPFRRATTLRFTLRRPEVVRLAVHDVAGRRVRTLLAGRREAGAHALAWDGRDAAGRQVAAGVYFVRLETPASRRTAKIVRRD